MDAEMRAAAADIAKRHRLDVKIEQIWYFPPSPFARELVEAVRRGAEQAGYAHMDIVSGAGHDACYVSRVAPTAMIFVPCKDGISHNEIEDADKADIGAGCPDPAAGDGRDEPIREIRAWSRPPPRRWSPRWRASAAPCRSCWRPRRRSARRRRRRARGSPGLGIATAL